MAGDILKGLPSFNKENFSKFKVDENIKSTNARTAAYIHTEESESEESQVIITDKTNILLRYLQKQLSNKSPQNKRNTSPPKDLAPNAKIPRLDSETND